MKRMLLVLTTIMSTMTFAQDCTDLFISEYVEGWSNNKAVEIYNPTNATIDLSNYMVIRYSNGATTATAANAVQLTGTIAPYDVYVAVLEKLDPNGTQQEAPVWDSLQIRADGFYCPDYNTTNAFYWNGNDAVALAIGTVNDIPNSTLVDVFGKIGEDPGVAWTSDFPYTGAGDEITKDHSLIRKANILHGETNPTISYFDALLEYDSIPAVIDIGGQTYGNWFSLGEHTCDCATSGVDESLSTQKLTIFPNPTSGEFFVNNASNYTTVVVINALGQEVASVENNTNAVISFDLGKRNGVYFVKLTDQSNNTIVKKVIVK
ncbi:MAG: lamin tail domain-containing protein [Crocinitomicaceae bacterium]|nr:lamin tail domain-containing protein [Crocinitomicaceae bacterium]